MSKTFYGMNTEELLEFKGEQGYGVSIAVSKGDNVDTFCSGSGRFGQDFPVNSETLFQAASISKPVFAMTLLRYVDKGVIDLDTDISGVISDFVKIPITFSALLSHTAGFNVHGFPGYLADHTLLTLEDVLSGCGNTPKLRRIYPYGEKYSYSGGGIVLAQLAFERLTGINLREAFTKEIAEPLGLTRTGYFQPLDENLIINAAFGGKLGIKENPVHGWHYYPECAAAGLWSTPTELTKIGIALSRSVRSGGVLKKRTAQRMITPVSSGYGLCIKRDEDTPNQVYHTGGNAGFVAYWILSITQDLCVAGMSNGPNDKLFDFINTLVKKENM